MTGTVIREPYETFAATGKAEKRSDVTSLSLIPSSPAQKKGLRRM